MLPAFTATGDTANILVTTFLRYTTAALVHLKMLTSQAASHGPVSPIHVDAISSFTKHSYNMFVQCDVPILSAQVVAEQMRPVDSVILRSLQNFRTSFRVSKVTQMYVWLHLSPHSKPTLLLVLGLPMLLCKRRIRRSPSEIQQHKIPLQERTQIINQKTTTYTSGINPNPRAIRHPLISLHLLAIRSPSHSHLQLNIQQLPLVPPSPQQNHHMKYASRPTTIFPSLCSSHKTSCRYLLPG